MAYTPVMDNDIVLTYRGRNATRADIAFISRLIENNPKASRRALSRNTTDEFNAILCNCLTHGRRHFVNEIDNFPQEAEHVIEVLAEVYRIDARTKKEKNDTGSAAGLPW
jgi:hypothetical protein